MRNAACKTISWMLKVVANSRGMLRGQLVNAVFQSTFMTLSRAGSPVGNDFRMLTFQQGEFARGRDVTNIRKQQSESIKEKS